MNTLFKAVFKKKKIGINMIKKICDKFVIYFKRKENEKVNEWTQSEIGKTSN